MKPVARKELMPVSRERRTSKRREARGAMPTFRELYCARHGCNPQHFLQQVFCSSFSRRAVLPGKLCLTLLHLSSFRPERELVIALGDATSLARFKEELHYFTNRRRVGWLRRAWGLKLSTRRLRSLASECFEPTTAGRHERPAAA
jgi:hypothetical protein